MKKIFLLFILLFITEHNNAQDFTKEIPAKYDWSWDNLYNLDIDIIVGNFGFTGGLLPARDQKSNLIGFVNPKGVWEIKPKYTEIPIAHGIPPFVVDKAVIAENGKYGIIDKKGKYIIKPSYPEIYALTSNSLAIVRDYNGNRGVIDLEGANAGRWNQIWGPGLHASSFSITTGMPLTFSFNGKNYFNYNEKNFEIPQDVYIPICEAQFVGPLIIAENTHGKIGLISRSTGTWVARPQYKMIHQESITGNGLYAAQQENGKWGFIDESGNWVIEPKFSYCIPFLYPEYTICRDVNSGKYGLIDESGNWCLDAEFDGLTIGQNRTIVAKKAGKVGIIKLETKTKNSYEIVQSDIDVNIPDNVTDNTNTFALIISNENYQNVAPVRYALNDGERIEEYCQKTLGMPKENIIFFKDATYGNIMNGIQRLKQISSAFDGEINIIIYYSGHGFPNEKNHEAYWIPVDGNPLTLSACINTIDLYHELNQIPSNNTILFVDACFSGAQRNTDGMLVEARGIAIKPKEVPLEGKLIIFTAAQGDETAYPITEKCHGLFTYYLLKKIQESKGRTTLGELNDYVTTNVKRQSVLKNQKIQTPHISISESIKENWREIKLK